jgi:hypothetical protein
MTVKTKALMSFNVRRCCPVCHNWLTKFSVAHHLCSPLAMNNALRFFLLFFIIIISTLQSTAVQRPLQLLAISLDLRLLAYSSCQLSCANCHSTSPEGVLQNVLLLFLLYWFWPIKKTCASADRTLIGWWKWWCFIIDIVIPPFCYWTPNSKQNFFWKTRILTKMT